MKKIFDSRFLFILALCLIVFIILGIGAFYLFDDSDSYFVKDGYVLNPLSAKSEKYLFNENTTYRENLSQMIVFDDVDKVETTVLKESFLHYNDGALSFLKNGAILDLNSINGKDAVKFYNITSKSIINRGSNGYVIASANGDIALSNFVGRISDNKYIVVGNLEAKIPGNEKNIKGDYFEVVYTDEGIINIENNDVKFQVTAEGSYIYAGNVTIDLGNKKIAKNGEDVMSITAITISGDENIEIIPKAEEKEDDSNNGGAGNGTGTDTTNPTENPNNTGNDNTGNENNNDQPGQVIVDDSLLVSLKDYVVGSTSITAVFNVDNQRLDDNLTLKVTNLDTGRTIDEKYNVMSDQEIRIPKLAPNTKYLLTVLNERDENKYFQKIFETNSFGVSITKSYATSSELGYKITVDRDSDITDVRVTLKKYDENADELIDVTSYMLSDLVVDISGEHDGINFLSLDSDSIYTVVLDNFSTDSTRFNDLYNVSLTSMTLKETPDFGTMKQETGSSSFKLYLDGIVDKDNAITGYEYYIYEGNLVDSKVIGTMETAIDPIIKSNATPVEIGIGEGENQLRNDTNYFYKVAIKYFDNEKYVERELDGSISLFIGSNPFVTITKNDNQITYNQIGATILITDNSCLLPMPGRENCDDTSTVQIDVKKRDINGETTLPGYPITNVAFDINGSIIKKDLLIGDLDPGVTYVIYVSGEINGKFQVLERGEVYENEITTKYLANFNATWEDEDSTVTNAIDTSLKLVGIERSNAMSSEATAGIIQKVVVRLYDGEFSGSLQNQRLLASEEFVNTEEFNLKENFYDNSFEITEASFSQIGSADALAALNASGKLSEAYTLSIEAYYDTNETKAVGIASATVNHTYIINPDLYTEIEEPELVISEIYKARNDNFSNLLTNGETVVGYNLQARYDRDGFLQVNRTVNDINIYVYNEAGEKVQFYIMDNGVLTLTDKITASLGNAGSYEDNIYLANGTEYGIEDTIMTRGNRYYIGFEITYTHANGVSGIHPINTNRSVPSSYGYFPDINGRIAEKAPAKVNYLYIDKSTTDNKLTYNYEIKDIDNAVYKTGDSYKVYYHINDEGENGLVLTKTDDVVKTFRGSFTLTGLSNGDGYTLYYKKNIFKTNELETDIVNYTIGSSNRLFDGYHNALDNQYNFKFEIINNPLQDNKVTLKMLTTEEMLNRIFSYKVKFTDTLGHELEREVWQLAKCDDDSNDDINRCIQVSYIDLKNAGMKSNGSEVNTITVSVQAIYDNGLTGYSYASDIGEGKTYPYMIMQDDSTVDNVGGYIIINNRVLMKSSARYPKGYYTYDISNGYFSYNSKYSATDKVTSIPVSLDSQGYYISLGSLNPKMISVDAMSSDDNEFSFSSITPTIKEDNVIRLINGAKIDLILSGADINDFCDDVNGSNCVNNDNGNKYLYIDVWDDADSVGLAEKVIPTIKVKLDNDNINKTYTADIINLLHGRKYYYNVYVYLNDNGTKVYTQLFDDNKKNESVTYTFESKRLNEIFNNSFTVNYKPNPEGEYNDKLLDMKFNLIPYDDEATIPFDYNITYLLCDEANECGLDNNIFKKDVANIEASVIDTVDISTYDLVFGKDYYMYMYVTYNSYDSELGSVKQVTYPFYSDANTARTFLAELERPEFVVTRKASYVEGQYVIDFTVNASDVSRVLIDGKYRIQLLDEDNEIAGILQVKEDDGTYRTIMYGNPYGDYEFSLADATNQSFRIAGLAANTKYTLKIIGDAYMNNEGVEEPNVVIISGPAGDGYKVWTTNAYGVAFGNEVTYGATKNSIVVYYPGGSNFENVREVIYEIENIDTKKHYYGSYTIGENNKYFEFSTTYDRWMFEIDPEDMDNNVGEIFTVTTSYMVYDAESGHNMPVDYTVYSSLSSRFTYVE